MIPLLLLRKGEDYPNNHVSPRLPVTLSREAMEEEEE